MSRKTSAPPIATGILEFNQDCVKQYHMGYEAYLEEKQKQAGGIPSGTTGRGGAQAVGANTAPGNDSEKRVGATAPTLSDVFDKKTYYNPLKIISRLEKQLEKYERQLSESEAKAAELQLQLMDPELATNYPKLMELQEAITAEEQNQESLLERMLETETELNSYNDLR